MRSTGRFHSGSGTIVGATRLSAPSSTQNASRERGPEMHLTRKGNSWNLGMKMHAGADVETGYIHMITATAANVHDVDQAANLIREDHSVVCGDAGYLGMEKRKIVKARCCIAAINTFLSLVSDDALARITGCS